MRLVTVRTDEGTRAARVEGDRLLLLPFASVDDLLRHRDWRHAGSRASGTDKPYAGSTLAPVVISPRKIVCVGHNYLAHIAEMGRDRPEFPTLFSKFATSLIGPTDDIRLPAESKQMDWEAELAVVIGARCRRVQSHEAVDAIAGYTILNDVTARDWQRRTGQWLQGKTFDQTAPLGPELVTADELSPIRDHEISCAVDGVTVQRAHLSDLVFPPEELVSYISQFLTLEPGDIIATGTPSGVGFAHRPRQFLQPGSVLETTVEAIGTCRNTCVADPGNRTNREGDAG